MIVIKAVQCRESTRRSLSLRRIILYVLTKYIYDQHERIHMKTLQFIQQAATFLEASRVT